MVVVGTSMSGLGKWMGQQGERGGVEHRQVTAGKELHVFDNKQQKTDFINYKRLCEKLKEVIVHIPNILIYKLCNHCP